MHDFNISKLRCKISELLIENAILNEEAALKKNDSIVKIKKLERDFNKTLKMKDEKIELL